tara:strand:- start:650 stop:802 length:153 start_codon:yes stop_codon:yes gene_type:complete
MSVMAKNSASRSSHRLAALKKVKISHKAALAVFLEVIITKELPTKKSENT